MRVSKEPEVRKQEILDAAMKVFARKGYEAATMKDIAGEANVVAGLCYHYFRNKQELYETAASRYAKECSKAFIDVFLQTELSIEACLDQMEKAMQKQEKEYKYKEFFDKKENEFFHKQLELYMTKETLPYLEGYLNALAQRGAIKTADVSLLARFLWGGQMAVVTEESIPLTERMSWIREMIKKLI